MWPHTSLEQGRQRFSVLGIQHPIELASVVSGRGEPAHQGVNNCCHGHSVTLLPWSGCQGLPVSGVGIFLPLNYSIPLSAIKEAI